ncbi:MAG TPA: hypothetical protein VGH28_06655 [Polyangiaceae bacterium]
MTFAGSAGAAGISVTPSGGSLSEQLTELASLVKPDQAACTEHCWVLERMHVGGAVPQGKLDFEIGGSLLEKGSYEIPLFAPAEKIRLENVAENGHPATLGFENGHWYLHTSAPHFTIRGKLVLPEDRTLTIVGPLNAFDADVTGGRVTEGDHLTGVTGGQLHFDAEGAAPPAQPAVFSIARALRVGKSIDFEYRLTAQSGTELGLLHFPLKYGERVLDVAGSTGWRAESDDLVLPTTGKNAEITITGTLANVASFSPDPRAPFEWWLLETDAEHRIVATGDAKQHDASESPIVRREPSSRLYLVQRGQHLDVTVQTLQSVDVLAATIRSHSRTLVLTAAGDLVAQDTMTYDNNGLDYLYFTPDGKPLYLATDGAAERVMNKDGSEDLAIPMRLGQHTITVQSLSGTSIGTFFGRVAMPGPRVPLATASEDITVGLPTTLHPVIVTGGERTTFPFSTSDAIALALSALAACLALAGWKKRALGTATMLGLWFVGKPLFIVALAIGAGVLVWPLFMRLGTITRRVTLGVGLLLATVIGVPLMVAKSYDSPTATAGAVAQTEIPAAVVADQRTDNAPMQAQSKDADVANVMKQDIAGHAAVGGFGRAGMLDGVRPVALTMPGYAHTAYASRQLLTPSRTFQPVVYYVTDAGLAFLGLAWLACAGALAWSSRDRLRALREKIRAWLAPKPADASAPTISPDLTPQKA